MKRFDVFGMCNALFDVQAEVDDGVIAAAGLVKGTMSLCDEAGLARGLAALAGRPTHRAAGGSGANTMLGVALYGGQAAFTSRVGDDEAGEAYRASLVEHGVTANLRSVPGTTGTSVVMISPDAQRTMLTFLGVSRTLEAEDLDLAAIGASRFLYVTGYLWDTPNLKRAVGAAMDAAAAGGTTVAFSLSDPFCVHANRDDFLRLLDGRVGLVFANADEAAALTGQTEPAAAAAALAARCGMAAVTCDARGSVLATRERTVAIPAYPVRAVDTTGAGDMYAAGLLYGLSRDLPLETAGRIAAWGAAQVVAQLGPRLAALPGEAAARIRSGQAPE